MYHESALICKSLNTIEHDFSEGVITFDQAIDELLKTGSAELGLALVDANRHLSELDKLEYSLQFAVINNDNFAYTFAATLYGVNHFSPAVFKCMYNYACIKANDLLKSEVLEKYENLFGNTEEFVLFQTAIKNN